jgi:ankyrin repeat protein
MHGDTPTGKDRLVEIARRLCSHGANPNAEYHWNWHPELPRTVLWASICAVAHLSLAQVLLEAGANPTDGVSVHIAGGGGNIAALELLHGFGLNVNGIPGGVPPLVYTMFWSTNPAVRAGCSNMAPTRTSPGVTTVNRRSMSLLEDGDVSMVELLVQHGADPLRRRADGCTAHTLAELHGNHDVGRWLLAHGAKDELSSLERFIAACARGDGADAEAMVASHPALRADLRLEHHLMLQRPAESGNAPVLETMLSCGFDPNAKDKDNVTALHRAAMGDIQKLCACC